MTNIDNCIENLSEMLYNFYSERQNKFDFHYNYFINIALHIRSLRSLRAYRLIVNEKIFFSFTIFNFFNINSSKKFIKCQVFRHKFLSLQNKYRFQHFYKCSSLLASHAYYSSTRHPSGTSKYLSGMHSTGIPALIIS